MNRFVLGLFGAALAIGLAIYLWPHGGDAPVAAPAGSASASAAPIVRDHVHGTPPALPATTSPVTGEDPGSGSADEYAVGGVQVRDHRGGSNAHMDVPPSIHPPNLHQISSAIVQDVAQQVRGVMKQCTAQLAGATGSGGRLEGQLVVAIKDHQLTVTGATMKLRDVAGETAAAAGPCIEHGSIGLVAGAAGEPDVDHYAITVNFALP